MSHDKSADDVLNRIKEMKLRLKKIGKKIDSAKDILDIAQESCAQGEKMLKDVEKSITKIEQRHLSAEFDIPATAPNQMRSALSRISEAKESKHDDASAPKVKPGRS